MSGRKQNQKENKFLKTLKQFGNAQIAGDSGIGTSIAIASGYKYNFKNKKWEQTEENLKEAERLKNNLAGIGLGGIIGLGTPSIIGILEPVTDAVDTGVSLATGNYIEAGLNLLPYDKIFKIGTKRLKLDDLYTNITRSKSFHSDYLDGPNPLNARNPDQVYGILEDVVSSSNPTAYVHIIDGGDEFILGKHNGMTNVSHLVQMKSPKDITLLTNGSNWKNLSIFSPDEQINLYRQELNKIISKNSSGYKKRADQLKARIKYIQDNKQILQQQYDRIKNLQLDGLSTDEIAKKLVDNDDVGNIIFRDIYDGHTGDQIIMNTKIGHPKSIHGGNNERDFSKRNPLKLLIPGSLGMSYINNKNE